jgi:hypothetical protein
MGPVRSFGVEVCLQTGSSGGSVKFLSGSVTSATVYGECRLPGRYVVWLL